MGWCIIYLSIGIRVNVYSLVYRIIFCNSTVSCLDCDRTGPICLVGLQSCSASTFRIVLTFVISQSFCVLYVDISPAVVCWWAYRLRLNTARDTFKR